MSIEIPNSRYIYLFRMTLYLRNHFYGWVCLNFYVMVPKAHQTDNRSYVSSADLPSDSLRKILACLAVTRRTSKKHKTVKIGACPGRCQKAYKSESMVNFVVTLILQAYICPWRVPWLHGCAW